MGRKKEAAVRNPAVAPLQGGDEGPSTSYGASGLPPHLELARTRVVCGTDVNLHVSYEQGAQDSLRAL